MTRDTWQVNAMIRNNQNAAIELRQKAMLEKDKRIKALTIQAAEEYEARAMRMIENGHS